MLIVFIDYFTNNFQPAINIPIMIVIGILAFLFSWIYYGRQDDLNQHQKRFEKSALMTLLAVYIYFIIAVTLINRSVTDNAKAELVPLWSWYQVIVNHSPWFLEEIVLNIILFIPFGVFFKLTTNISTWRAFLVGFGFSLVIELLEYAFCRGLFEWDDMLHNALGCMIGVMIAKLFKRTSEDPEEEIKKEISDYKKTEDAELPTKAIAGPALGALVEYITKYSERLGRHLSDAVGEAAGESAEQIVDSAFDSFLKYKRNRLLEAIADYDRVLTDETIDKIESISFILEFEKTMEVIDRLATDKKLNYICNCFGRYFLAENHGDDTDEYDEYLEHLEVLSYREIDILVKFYHIEKSYIKSDDNPQVGEEKRLSPIHIKSTRRLTNMAAEWGLRVDEMPGVLTSLSRTGFVREEVGTYTDYTGGVFYTTEYFENFLKYILPNEDIEDSFVEE